MATFTITQAELRRRTLETMEDDLRISDKQAKDFVNSLIAVVEEGASEGAKISVFGIVNLNPGFRLAKPKRKGVDPRTGEETVFNATPNKVTIRAAVTKRVKDALPGPATAAGKVLKEEAEDRVQRAAERLAKAEREAKKAERATAKKGKGKK